MKAMLPPAGGVAFCFFGLSVVSRDHRVFRIATPARVAFSEAIRPWHHIRHHHMDLTDEQQDALDSVASAFDDPDAFTKALHSSKPSLYQSVYDEGHQAGLGKVNGERDRYKDKAESLEARVDTLESELEAAREEQPDLESLRQTWEEEELRPLKEKAEELNKRLTSTREDSVLQSVEKRIRDKVANEWVAERLTREARDRIDVSGESPTFYRPDGQTPYAAAEGQDARDLFAEDLLGSIPDDLRAPSKAQGTGFQNGQGGSAKGVTKATLNSDKAKKAAFFAEQRGKGNDPVQAYKQLPDE